MRGFALPVVIGLAAGSALAASTGNNAAGRWERNDLCAKKALEAFPDWTKEQLALRDAYVRKCIAERRAPATETISPKPRTAMPTR